MPFNRSIIFLVHLIVASCFSTSFAHRADSLQTSILSNDPAIRLQALYESAVYHFKIIGRSDLSDSLSLEALQTANNSGNEAWIFQALIQYVQLADPGLSPDCEHYAKQAIYMAEKKGDAAWKFEAMLEYAALLVRMEQYHKGREELIDAARYSNENKERLIRFNLLIGYIQEMNHQHIKALDAYFHANLLAKDIENDSLQYESYKRLYVFYEMVGNHEKAIEYNLSAARLIAQSSE